MQRWHPYKVSFLICCIQCHLHLFPFFEPMWTISWLFSFAAVTGPMYTGASAFFFLNENPEIHPIAISSQKSRWAYVFLGCLVEVLQYKNVVVHYAGVHKIPRGCTSMLWQRRSQHHISCAFESWQSTPFMYLLYMLNVLWLTYLDHLMTQSPVCVNNIFGFEFVLNKSYSSIVLPNSGHQVWACYPKHHGSFYQVYKYPLEDTSYSLILSHCSMFYKPASPSITEQI